MSIQETEERKILSLEKIKTKYPPQSEAFGEGKIQAEVSRNEEGVIVYVVPGSTKKLLNN